MKIDIITLFPDMFSGPFATSMLKKAQDKGLAQISFVNLRDFGLGPRKQVDDTPYGGGDGMVLKPEPVVAAIESVKDTDSVVILMTPQGKTYSQPAARKLAKVKHLIIVCGHYEGFDERIRSFVDLEISIGDYVLTGGEIPAMVVVDSVVRLIPGVLGGDQSAVDESFTRGKQLEYPQYTRPENFRGMKVPKVLQTGHHGEIAAWRAREATKNTHKRAE
ncbi:tRNA (guanosine(37)-N1)-methyltransferase TrmD [Candidatus Microgenomates bacterium]|nr:tRNA (guanosine(37)-N1)-methyltransferase TrmD [Candidatus Microgenomates bacterium]